MNGGRADDDWIVDDIVVHRGFEPSDPRFYHCEPAYDGFPRIDVQQAYEFLSARGAAFSSDPYDVIGDYELFLADLMVFITFRGWLFIQLRSMAPWDCKHRMRDSNKIYPLNFTWKQVEMLDDTYNQPEGPPVRMIRVYDRTPSSGEFFTVPELRIKAWIPWNVFEREILPAPNPASRVFEILRKQKKLPHGGGRP